MFEFAKFETFFDAEDTEGVTHTGFLQSLDLSGYTDITLLNDITETLLDAYLFQQIRVCAALDQWAKYATWDKAASKILVDPDFYDAFAAALYVSLLQAQNFDASILTYDFKSVSKQEQKEIIHGTKTTTRNYDKVVLEIKRNQDKQTIGQREDTIGQRQDTLGSRTDNATPGQETVTNKLYPLGASAYVDDTQTITTALQSSSTIGQQINTAGEQQNTTGEQEITQDYGDVTNETGAREDTEEITTYTDTENYTKHVIITPEKYFEIQKELVSINAYTLIRDAVYKTFSKGVWL